MKERKIENHGEIQKILNIVLPDECEIMGTSDVERIIKSAVAKNHKNVTISGGHDLDLLPVVGLLAGLTTIIVNAIAMYRLFKSENGNLSSSEQFEKIVSGAIEQSKLEIPATPKEVSDAILKSMVEK